MTVTPTLDATDEPDEFVILNVATGSGYTVGSPSTATGTIADNDGLPTISINNVTAAEGNSASPTNFTFAVTLSHSSSSAITVNYATASGTSNPATGGANCTTAGTDFVNILPTQLSFAAGETSKQVAVSVCGDTNVEANETFFVNLSGNSANSVLTAGTKGTGTITNDDLPNVSVAVLPTATAEDGSTNLVYTFTRNSTIGSLTVNYSVSGTATLGSDYSAPFTSTGSVTIADGTSTATVTVTPIADTTDEPDETVILTISANAAYTIAAPPQNAASGTITDDDATPTIQITSVTAPEPSPGPTSFVFTISLTNPSSSQITVNYATDTTGATATAGTSCSAGVDFVSISGPLTFSPGDTSEQVSVTVCGDSVLEPDETFFVNLSGNSANSVLQANTKGTGTITPQAPVVFTEEGNGTFAVAVDSVTFVRGPFRLTNDFNLTPSDRATRVILITSNLGMTQADLATPNLLSVHIAGYGTLPIENVGPITGVPGLSASYIIVQLPAGLSTLNPSPGPNNLTLTVKMGSATSNATILSIAP